MIFWYSGCGDSKFVAEQIAQATGESMGFIPDLQREGFDHYEIPQGESVGFVFPVYAWGAPPLVEAFVSWVKWSGKASYVWFACTCGDEMGYTYRSFGDILRGAGLELDACFCFQMPETYLCYPGFHLDTKEGAQKKIDATKAKLPSVIEAIRSRSKVVDHIVGGMPALKSGLIRKGFIRFMSDKKYHVTDVCTGCGVCQKKCPLHNIEMVQGKPKWKGGCTQCMACYHYCPQNAVQFGKCTKDKGQYHF